MRGGSGLFHDVGQLPHRKERVIILTHRRLNQLSFAAELIFALILSLHQGHTIKQILTRLYRLVCTHTFVLH